MRMRRWCVRAVAGLGLIGVGLGSLGGAGSPARGGDWPDWRGPNRDGVSSETNWVADWTSVPPEPAWATAVGTGLAAVITWDQRAYTLGNRDNTDTVWCFDAASGKVRWRFDYPSPSVNYTNNVPPHGPASTPTLKAGRIFTLSREGELYCLDATAGTVVWRRHLVEQLGGRRPRYGYAGTPLVHQDSVYLDVGGEAVSVAALEAGTGRMRWQQAGGQAGYASPQLLPGTGRTTVVVFQGEAVTAWDSADGQPRWQIPWRGSEFCNTATPAVAGSRFAVSGVKRQHSDDGDGTSLFAWDGQAVRRLWHQSEPAMMFGSPTLWNGLVLGFHDGRRPLKTLVALELQTGKTRWISEAIDNGGFVVAGDHLLALTQGGELVAAALANSGCRVLGRYQVFGGKTYAPPVLSDGHVFCRNNDGRLVCLRLPQPLP